MLKTNVAKKLGMYAILCLSAVLFPSIAHAATYSTSDYVVKEYFSSYTTGTAPTWWISDSTGGSITVQNVPSSSDKSVYLNDTSTVSTVNLSSVIPAQTDKVTAEFSVMLPTKVNNHKLFRLVSSNSAIAVSIETINGNICYRSATSQTLVSNYSANTWYNIKIEANPSSKTASVYVNGIRILADVAYNNTAAIDISKLEAFTTNSGTGSFYLDNIKVYTSSTISNPNIVVAKDGTGNYSTIQAAVNAAVAGNTIYVKNGIYNEVVTVNTPYITIIGESSRDTIISYNNAASTLKPDGTILGTSGSSTMYVYKNDFIGKNFTVQNAYDETAYGPAQAVALFVSGDRAQFTSCRILGNQDTLYTKSNREYFKKCYIEGDVDFIFGSATAVFEDCEIFSVSRTGGGVITAASTAAGAYGYLFNNCRIKGATPANTFWLGRPWGKDAHVIYKKCYLGPHIQVNGWTAMGSNAPENARFYEYANFGPGAYVNSYRRQLTSTQAATYNKSTMLSGSDGWNP